MENMNRILKTADQFIFPCRPGKREGGRNMCSWISFHARIKPPNKFMIHFPHLLAPPPG